MSWQIYNRNGHDPTSLPFLAKREETTAHLKEWANRPGFKQFSESWNNTSFLLIFN